MEIKITNNTAKTLQSETDFKISFKIQENEVLSIETIKLINSSLLRAFSQSFEQ